MPADRNPQRHRLVVSDDAGSRLDAYLAAHIPELSRSRAAQLLAGQQVLVNGEVARKSQRVASGDVIELEVPAPQVYHVAAEAIPLEIVYQDEDVIVLNKSAGVVVHPAPGHAGGTLVNALLHHVTDLSGIGGELRPGVVHRLDKDTSGLMLVAKNDAAHRRLSEALKRREIRRSYTVAAWGHLASETLEVNAPIGRSRTDRKRMTVTADGRVAITRFRRLSRWRAADLLEAVLETGRTHQIRVHLAHVGHPVVGDRTYSAGAERGMSGARQWAAELSKRVPRQFLHAAQLSFAHPRTGAMMRFETSLPADLAAAAEWAEASSRGR